MVNLKVSPAQLKQGAGELEQHTANAYREWNRLCDIIKTSRYYWEGEAGNCGRALLEEMSDEVEVIFRRLNENPKKLLQMAGLYIDTEEKAAALANVLPDNVL